MAMTPDQYVHSVLQRYVVNHVQARSAAEAIAPHVRTWAGAQLSDLTYSGSFAKGTGNNISTDVDLFISLRADTQATLKEIYGSLLRLAQTRGWSPRPQNVSIGISFSGRKIDLVPGRVQAG
jgi:tRNA nucleotidyltransferase (CCA-adding enzyme)